MAQPELVASLKKVIRQHAKFFTVKITDSETNMISRNTCDFIATRLAETRQKGIGASAPPYVIEEWSDISVKRRSIFGAPVEDRKGYTSAVSHVGGHNGRKLYGRRFPQDDDGLKHDSSMFVTDAVWKIATDQCAEINMTARNWLTNRWIVVNAIAEPLFKTSVAELREHCLRKTKKDQLVMLVGPDNSPCGLKWRAAHKPGDHEIRMTEMSQILSLFGTGPVGVTLTKGFWVFQNRFFSYVVEWKKK